MPDALDRKLAELEHRLLAGHEQIGRGVGVPFLLLLHPPSEELRVRRDVNSLVAKLATQMPSFDRRKDHRVCGLRVPCKRADS